MIREINEECGVFGIFSPKKDETIMYNTYLGLCSLQHRGEESCGIAINEDGFITCKKDIGLVSEVFKKHHINDFVGKMSLGQVKYSGVFTAKKENAQPLVIRFQTGNMAIAYNGNLINSMDLKKELREVGVIFQSSSDAEVICSLIARERVNSVTTEEAILKIMNKLKGAYSFVVMTKRKMIAVRDPHGFKPLSMGKLGESTVFSSETCALDIVGAEYVRDIEPGEVYCISDEKTTSKTYNIKTKPAVCIFEYIYFSRPDSYIGGVSVHSFRKDIGKFLACSNSVKADVVCGVPDSGLDSALGYSKESKIPYDIAFIKNKYIGRTFIKFSQKQRKKLVQVKLSVLKSSVKDKRVILIDDSIVRGTTIELIIKSLKNAGAKEVHVRIASPMYINVCYFGTDVDNKEDLISCNKTKEEIKEQIGADSLEFLRVEDLNEIARLNNIKGHCNGCFTSSYPMEVPDKIERDIFEKIL